MSQNAFSSQGAVASVASNRNANTQVLPQGINKSWYSEAVANIQEREYFIRTLELPGVFGAVNHAQHLTYLFNTDGYTVSNFNETGSSKAIWNSRFIIRGIGRNGNFRSESLQSVHQAGDEGLHYSYNSYAVDYSNRREGMEQSFVINRRAAGKRSLQIAINVEGDLQARLSGEDQLLLSSNGQPKDVKLIYDQLKAWDKNGVRLPSKMLVRGPHSIVLSIDDSKAVYPITVDPLNHTPGWIMDPLGNVVTPNINETVAPVLGGYSVTGVGDVNGDGNDDIVIGAPYYTTITFNGTNLVASGNIVGAAFLFYGVHAGSPAITPSQVLQPTGLAPGALFGFSISTAGNIDGDTKADFIIGAPGDTISIIIIRPHTGKVYAYRGASMGTNVTSIPAPSAILAPIRTIYSTNLLYGFSVGNAGDIDGDGFSDVIIGSPGASSGTGLVDIWRGSGNAGMFAGTSSKTINGILSASLFGFSVSGAGDVNHDAIPDIIVGAPGELNGLPITAQGGAYVFHGTGTTSLFTASDANGATGVDGSAMFGAAGALFGFSVSNAGDVNGDGIGDVIVGEPLALDHGAAAGAAFIAYGTNSPTGLGASPAMTTLRSRRSPAATSTTQGLNLLFGFSVGMAGNAVGDLASDVLVGEPGSATLLNGTLATSLTSLGLSITAPTLVFNGAAYLFDGHVGTGIANNAAPYWYLQNSDFFATVAESDFLGGSVHYAGDVNGDGFGDFLVGSSNGILDLGINLANVSSSLSLTIGGGGLIASATVGNSYLFIGFSAPLPVTLLTFTGAPVDGTTLLSWSTALEQNTDYFDIERSTDGSTFTSIGKTPAAGNSSLKKDYTYTDATPVVGANYYRLKMVDLDGKFTYSKIVVVSFQTSGPSIIAAYPNPAHDNFQLVLKNMPPGRYRMSMVSAVGQAVFSKNIQVSNPIHHSESVSLPVITPGSYWIRLIDEKNHSFLSRMEIR